MSQEEDKTAVLVLAFGGAESVEKIGPFLKNILKGRTVPMELLARTIERYKLIGGKSPLPELTGAQAEALGTALKKRGRGCKVYVGMRHWDPYIREAVTQMSKDGVEMASVVIMAPITSPVATGGYDKDVRDTIHEVGGNMRLDFVDNWHINPVFIDLVIDGIKEELKAFSSPDEALVIFSNHSLPMEALEGDVYEFKIRQTVEKIVEKFPVDYKVAYQSQGAGRFTWLGPMVEDVMEEALSFVVDNIETLYDIDIHFKQHAEALGLVFKRTPTFNSDARFIDMLADLIVKSKERFA
jgi:ferrochelatase